MLDYGQARVDTKKEAFRPVVVTVRRRKNSEKKIASRDPICFALFLQSAAFWLSKRGVEKIAAPGKYKLQKTSVGFVCLRTFPREFLTKMGN